MPPASPLRVFRLREELEGVVRSHLLTESRVRVGSAPGNDIVLSVRGVSRFHALLSPDGDTVLVQDLDSKNGTLLNGARVEQGRLLPGDEVQFGPVRLRLDQVDADDAALAVSFAVGDAGATEAPSATSTTATVARPRVASGGRWLEVVESVIGRLSVAPEADLGGALRALVAELSAAGACLIQWTDAGEAVVVAAVGGIESPLSHTAFLSFVERAHGRGATAEISTAIFEGEPVLSCGLVSNGGERLALVLFGDFPERRSSEPLLRVVLTLLDRFRPRPIAPSPGVPRSRVALEFPAGYVPGSSAAMVSLYGQMVPLIEGDLPVLILGETGVGKEHLARTLHDSSARRRGPFVAINCAAIPAELLESEMFGIGKGVATGVVERVGKFQLAEGGTLFLDEIGDMPLDLQAKLLRALQEKEVHAVGSSRPVKVDIRVVAATNSDLLQRVEAGRFRRDVYYRVAGYVLNVPPLRERREDIAALVEALVQRFSKETSKPIRGVTVKALKQLVDHAWPGNVRELEHEVRRLVYLCAAGAAIDSTMLAGHLSAAPAPPSADTSVPEGDSLSIEDHVGRVEARLIRAALERTNGNRTEAAKLLGISRNGLAIKMERLGIAAAAESA
jgi:DNA-binding NtrC family response regulator